MTLTRETWGSLVFKRDHHQCVVPGCENAAVDPHHIVERKLWLQDDPCPEGYDLNNGASLCEQHHIDAELNHLPPQALRRWLSLPTVLPQQLDPTKIWDKWGKEIAPMALEKYPRTPYFNFSETQDEEDGCIDNRLLIGKPLVVTVKMDGSNVTVTREKVAARNGQHATHPSFNLLKQLHAGFRTNIPEGIKLFGEWLFAKHSIHYKGDLALPAYFQVFAIYEITPQLFWGWDEVVDFCDVNGFTTVPELARGTRYNKEWEMIQAISGLAQGVLKMGHEGLVVKNTHPFHFTQHADNVAKIVRPNHVQTDQHWREQQITRNELL